MLKYHNKFLIGKLFNKKEVEKENYTTIVKQHLEVEELVEHPFLPSLYEIVETETHFMKIN